MMQSEAVRSDEIVEAVADEALDTVPGANSDSSSAAAASEFHFSRQLSALGDPQSISAESFRALRTHLLAQHIRDGRRSLAICAASVGVGCTYTAANLAVSMALGGVKTLLIDANLRRPGLDALIRSDTPKLGLYHYLSDPNVAAADVVSQDVIPGLSIMYAGAAATDAQELLAGSSFKTLIDGCLRDFELTIVDTAPANLYADARRVASVLRYALVVACKNESFVSDVRALVDELQTDRAKVIGTFLNDY